MFADWLPGRVLSNGAKEANTLLRVPASFCAFNASTSRDLIFSNPCSFVSEILLDSKTNIIQETMGALQQSSRSALLEAELSLPPLLLLALSWK